MVIRELKEALKHRNLSVKGKKKDLVERLEEAIRQERELKQGISKEIQCNDIENLVASYGTKLGHLLNYLLLLFKKPTRHQSHYFFPVQ